MHSKIRFVSPDIKATAYHWLLGERPRDCLSENLLLLFGNPDLFERQEVQVKFQDVERVGVFFQGWYQGVEVTFTTPKFGAPAVAMYLEVAALANVQRVVGLGYVGGLREEVTVGSLFLPERAVGLDGTTAAYLGPRQELPATPWLRSSLEEGARTAGLEISRGTVVSIDALMLETSAQINEWHAGGYSAVDLETACLFGVGAPLGLDCAALHIVSDNPFRGDTDRETHHMASLGDQLGLALDTLARVSKKEKRHEGY